MTKVCILTPSPYERSPRLERTAQTLVGSNEITVIEFKRGSREKTTKKIGNVQLIITGSSWVPNNNLLKAFVQTIRVLPIALEVRADVVHCAGFYTLPMGILIKRFTGKKLVYDCYEDYPYQLTRSTGRDSIRNSIVSKLVTRLEEIMACWCDHVLVVPSFRDILLRRFQRLNCVVVTVLWNVPSVKMREGAAPFSSTDRGESLLYVGGIEKEATAKVLEALVEVRKQFPQVKLILAGQLKTEAIHQQIKRFQLESAVEVLKPIPHAEVGRYYRRGVIGLVPYQPSFWTLRTKASEKLFEYMLFGLPVIVSDFPGLREIVEECDCGILVNFADPQSISEAVVSLLKDPVLRQRLGSNGQKATMEKYNWEREQRKVEDLYRNLAVSTNDMKGK